MTRLRSSAASVPKEKVSAGEEATLAIALLVPDPRNARKHNPRNIETVRNSLQKWGQRTRLVVRRQGMVVLKGNGTLAAAKQLGWTEIDCLLVDDDDKEGRAYAIADNRAAELADWDNEILREGLIDIGEMIKDVGFTDVDVGRIDRLMGIVEEDDDAGVEPVPEKPVAKLGDCWRLGNHLLLCGSCEELGVLMGEHKAVIMITDPPYVVSYANKNTLLNGRDRGNRIQTPIEGDHHTVAQMAVLWSKWFKAVRPLLAPGAAYYVTGPQGSELFLVLMQAMKDSGLPTRHMLVWAKNNHVLGRCDYHYKHEPIIYGWVEGKRHPVADRGEVSLWEIDRPHKSSLHPTMKPVELYARAMRNSTDRGALVLEPFAGSGTCYIAAEKLGRICVGSELDPRYCDVIVNRWQTFTGKRAKLIGKS